MIEDGKYLATAVQDSWKLGESSGGTPFINVQFKIDEGENAGEIVYWRSYFTDKTAERTMEGLRAAGWTGTDLAEIESLDRQVRIVVESENYEGKTYTKVKWVNALSGPMKGEMDDASKSAFAKRMKALAIATQPKDADVAF